MKKLLIAGWRGVHHSFAMVNQHQILSLIKCNEFKLFHHDMPLLMSHWNTKDHNPGFSDNLFKQIMSLNDIGESEADCVYRICAPMYPPSPSARKTITFGITELGYDTSNFSIPGQSLKEMTAGENIVVTSSRWSRDRMIDFGFHEEKLRVVSCGVDTEVFNPLSDIELISQRNALNIPDDTVIFVNVGVPTWNKGIDILIRTFALINQKHPNTKLFLKDARGLYGFPVDNILKEISNSNPQLITDQTRSSISIIPNNLSQNQLRSLYGMADCYISSYRAEGFNLPVLEAQACGTPVITTSGGATDDFSNTPAVQKIASTFNRGILRGSSECCWCEPYLPALEELMIQAVKIGPRRSHESDSLRQSARTNSLQYTWDEVAKSLISLI